MPANVTEMVFTGETPWHGIGEELEKVFTAEQAIKACPGLDANYTLEEIETKKHLEIPGRVAIVRHRAGVRPNVTGIVTPSYEIVQPRKAFEFMDGVVGEKLAMYHTAGVLGDGEKLWLLAKLPGEIEVMKDDILQKFILLTTGYDGVTASVFQSTPIRVVCQNTLNAALAGREAKIRVRHRGNVMDKLNEAKALLGLAVKYYDNVGGAFKKLAGFQMNSKHVKKLLDTILPLAEGRKADTSKGNAGNRERVKHLAEKGAGADIRGVRGTGWGWYNAVTEFVDHYRKTKVVGVKDPTDTQYREARLTSQWFGLGRGIKDKAFALLNDMADKKKASV